MAVENQEGQIAKAVNSLVRQAELTTVATSARSLVVAAAILLQKHQIFLIHVLGKEIVGTLRESKLG